MLSLFIHGSQMVKYQQRTATYKKTHYRRRKNNRTPPPPTPVPQSKSSSDTPLALWEVLQNTLEQTIHYIPYTADTMILTFPDWLNCKSFSYLQLASFTPLSLSLLVCVCVRVFTPCVSAVLRILLHNTLYRSDE